MKIITTYSCLLVSTLLAVAGPEAEAAKTQAQKCADAQIAKDYATVISYTHPALLKAAGGKEALQKALETAMKEVEKEGIKFEKTIVRSATEPKRVGKALVSQVTQEVTLRLPDSKMTQESVLLGYSYDEGKTWTFADTGEMDEAAFQKYFPELKGVISLPKKKDPVIVNDKKA
jgi:hypothetical protein